MKKRFLSLFLLASIVAGSFVGCMAPTIGSSVSSSDAPSASSSSNVESSSHSSSASIIESSSELSIDSSIESSLDVSIEEPLPNSSEESSLDSSEESSVEESSSESSEESSSTESSSSATTTDPIDFAAQISLDQETDETIKLAVTVKQHIDGDTTHFYFDKNADVPESVKSLGYLKVRYNAINTPESTGTIEPWGKAASDYTKNTLLNAVSIIVEFDSNKWEFDSNERALVWVWYKATATSEYRCLNIELLQEGYAWGSKISNVRYSEVCNSAITQAKALKLHVYSKDKDPGFYYGTAVELDLKELRTNIDQYVGKRVAFEGIVGLRADEFTIYVEDYDAETGMTYGIPIFYGYDRSLHDLLKEGNRVRVVGNLTNEGSWGYQVSSLKYNPMKPTHPDNVQCLEEGLGGYFTETTIETFNSKVTITPDTEGATPKTYNYADLALSTTISMKNLKVTRIYTTNNGGSSDGAMTLYCQDQDGNQIEIRTEVLRNPDMTVVTADQLEGKLIDIRGIIDQYNGNYQIRVFSLGAITIH